jgi:hypothetical protein
MRPTSLIDARQHLDDRWAAFEMKVGPGQVDHLVAG